MVSSHGVTEEFKFFAWPPDALAEHDCSWKARQVLLAVVTVTACLYFQIWTRVMAGNTLVLQLYVLL